MKSTFSKIVEILEDAEKNKKKLGGKPNKVSIPDRLLMTLEYLREYRTYFHLMTSLRAHVIETLDGERIPPL